MRRPLAEVMAWPDSHVRLQLSFLAKEPAAEDRIEAAIANLSALVWNLGKGRDTPAKEPADFLLAGDPWGVKQARAEAALDPAEMKLMQYLSRNP